MSFTVTGFDPDGIAYTAVVDPEEAQLASRSVGVVTGSPNVLSLLRLYEGREYPPRPTREGGIVDTSSPLGVLVALRALTTVYRVDGDAPAVPGDDLPEGAIP